MAVVPGEEEQLAIVPTQGNAAYTEPSIIQYRSNLQATIKMVNKLKFNAEQKIALETNCPFWLLIKAIMDKRITSYRATKSDLKLYDIIQKWCPEEKAFLFGTKKMPIYAMHIQKVFGVDSGKAEIVIEPGSKDNYIDFVDRCFEEGTKLMLKTNVYTALVKAVDSKRKESANDVVSLVTLYMLTTLFVPTSCSSIPWGYLEYLVKDVKKIKRYDWVAHTLERLYECLTVDNPNKVYGCVGVIPYILIERFNLQNVEVGKETELLWAAKYRLPDVTREMGSKTVEEYLIFTGINLSEKSPDRSMIVRPPKIKGRALAPEIHKRKRHGPKPKKKMVSEEVAKEIDDDVEETAKWMTENDPEVKGSPKTPRALRLAKRERKEDADVEEKCSPLKARTKRKKKIVSVEVAKEIDDDVEATAKWMVENDPEVKGSPLTTRDVRFEKRGRKEDDNAQEKGSEVTLRKMQTFKRRAKRNANRPKEQSEEVFNDDTGGSSVQECILIPESQSKSREERKQKDVQVLNEKTGVSLIQDSILIEDSQSKPSEPEKQNKMDGLIDTLGSLHLKGKEIRSSQSNDDFDKNDWFMDGDLGFKETMDSVISECAVLRDSETCSDTELEGLRTPDGQKNKRMRKDVSMDTKSDSEDTQSDKDTQAEKRKGYRKEIEKLKKSLEEALQYQKEEKERNEEKQKEFEKKLGEGVQELELVKRLAEDVAGQKEKLEENELKDSKIEIARLKQKLEETLLELEKEKRRNENQDEGKARANIEMQKLRQEKDRLSETIAKANMEMQQLRHELEEKNKKLENKEKEDGIIRGDKELQQEKVRLSDTIVKTNIEMQKLRQELEEKNKQIENKEIANGRLLQEKAKYEDGIIRGEKELQQEKVRLSDTIAKTNIEMQKLRQELEEKNKHIENKEIANGRLLQEKAKYEKENKILQEKIDQGEAAFFKDAKKNTKKEILLQKLKGDQEIRKLRNEIIQTKKEAAEKLLRKSKVATVLKDNYTIESQRKDTVISALEEERDYYKQIAKDMNTECQKLSADLNKVNDCFVAYKEEATEEMFEQKFIAAAHDDSQNYRFKEAFKEIENACEDLKSMILRVKTRTDRRTKEPYTPTQLQFPTPEPALDDSYKFKTPRLGDAVTVFDEPRSPPKDEIRQQEQEDKKEEKEEEEVANRKPGTKPTKRRQVRRKVAAKVATEVEQTNMDKLLMEQAMHLAQLRDQGISIALDGDFPDIATIGELTDVERPRHREKAHSIITKKSETEVTKRMTDELFNKLRFIHEVYGPWTALLYKPGKATTSYHYELNDVYKIIDGDELCNNIINAYAYMLDKEFNTKKTHAFKIFDSLCWTYIRDPTYKDVLQKKLDKPLAKHLQNPYDLLLFPINSNRNRELKYAPNHWTLLVFSNKEKTWRYYNSMLPRGDEERHDPYSEDAKLVAFYVESKLKDAESQPRFELNPETEHKFERMTDVPNQGSTVDCGLYVIFFIDCVVRNIQMSRQCDREFMLDFKAKVIARSIKNFELHQAEMQETMRITSNITDERDTNTSLPESSSTPTLNRP